MATATVERRGEEFREDLRGASPVTDASHAWRLLPKDRLAELTRLSAARTNVVGPVGRLLLFPRHVNYHVEHHLFPAVPHYRLPELHAELQRRGVLARAEVRPLQDTLKRVFAARSAGNRA